MDDRTEEAGGGGGAGASSPWEWVAAAVSTVMVLLVIGYIASKALTDGGSPPAVEVRPDSVLRAGGMWIVPFSAENRGDRTAADVQVRGELREGDRTVESSDAAVDYVPGQAVRRGGLFFHADPRAYRLELRALGYQDP